jgi:putative NIF3 family GTP cyclohydrolase 1 type 2
MLYTGELSHHEVLAAVAKGQYVVLCGHSNTERGFLNVLKFNLQHVLNDQVGKGTIEVIISTKDRDPLEII